MTTRFGRHYPRALAGGIVIATIGMLLFQTSHHAIKPTPDSPKADVLDVMGTNPILSMAEAGKYGPAVTDGEFKSFPIGNTWYSLREGGTLLGYTRKRGLFVATPVLADASK